MSSYPTAVYKALYCDEAGETIGLDEVQLLEPIPVERVSFLTEQLRSGDLYLTYQCGLILAAWGIKEGVNHLHQLVITRIDKIAELEPHRLWGEDNVYDVIADALGVAVLSDYNKTEVIKILDDILLLYGDCYFESKLKHVLIKLDDRRLLPGSKRAMHMALTSKRYYQASQLLPVIAKYDKSYATSQLPLFQQLIVQDDRIQYNIDETRAYV